MYNSIEFNSINSVCTTPAELIKSDDFIKWISIILTKITEFDKKYIMSLFIKLKNWDFLEDIEKKDLESFLNNKIVAELWQKLLWDIKRNSINIEVHDANELFNFSKLLNDIFKENGFKKIKTYILNTLNDTEWILNEYKCFTKLQIEINSEIKEIYLENDNFKVNSSNWKEKKIWWIKVKINPEWDITEYTDGESAWEQLFTWNSAIREVKKQWKKIPNSLEFQAIVTKIWIENFINKSIGFRYKDDSGFWDINRSAYFWLESAGIELAEAIAIDKNISEFEITQFNKNYGLSIKCIKY